MSVIRPRVEMRLGTPGKVRGMWPLDEASGTRLDVSGRGNHLADNNTVTQAAGVVADAAQFTAASNEYLSIADNDDLSMGGDVDFTIAAWVYLDSKSALLRPIVSKYDGDVEAEYALTYFGGGSDRFIFYVGMAPDGQDLYGVTANAFGSPSTGTWYLIVAWHDADGDTINICVNDGDVDSQAIPDGGVFDGPQPFRVGRHTELGAVNYYMDGRVDQLVVLKNFVPDADYRTWLYNGGAGRSATEIVEAADWVDVSADVVNDVVAEWGIHGGDPKERTAEPGSMSFDLDNSSKNSAGLRGYYSPEHPDARPLFGLGVLVRLVLNHATFGDKVKWVGAISALSPAPGASRPSTRVVCVDWMEEAARAKLSGIEAQTDIQSDAVFLLLAAAVDKQPPNGIRSGSGTDVYPYALDNAQDESSTVRGELAKVALSEFGLIYVSAGTLVFEGRLTRAGGGAVRFELHEDENIVGMRLAHSRDAIVNRVQVSVHPRRVDSAATTVLFTLGSALFIPRNTSVVVNAAYRDPNQQAQRVGGVDMVDPVASTDYEFNADADGGGADLTSQLSIVADFGGNQATLTITNAGPADGYIPAGGLQLRGRGLYDFEPMTSDQRDADSIASFGETGLAYDMPYQSSLSNAIDLGQFLLAQNKDEGTRIEGVTFVANWDDLHVEQAFNLEISDRVSVTSPTLGVDARPYYVNGMKLAVRMSGLVVVTWDLAPVDATEYWLLGVDGRTELDETTVLGYGLFAPAWILETDTLGTDTYLG